MELRKNKNKSSKCCICIIEALRKLMIDKKMDAEAFEKSREDIEWKMRSSIHRKRLVCSQGCYNEMMEIIGEDLRKCQNPKCKHSGRLHAEHGYCDAVKCKCYQFREKGDVEAEEEKDKLEALKKLESMPVIGAMKVIQDTLNVMMNSDSNNNDADGRLVLVHAHQYLQDRLLSETMVK